MLSELKLIKFLNREIINLKDTNFGYKNYPFYDLYFFYLYLKTLPEIIGIIMNREYITYLKK